MRAAASSRARGSPSSRRQMAATAAAFASVSAKSARAARARSTNRSTQSLPARAAAVGWPGSSGTARGGTGKTRSPAIASGSRLVARTVSAGRRREQRRDVGRRSDRPARGCRGRASVAWPARCFASVEPGLARAASRHAKRPCDRRSARGPGRGRRRAPRTRRRPGSRSRTLRPISIESRVLPVPPGPVSVSRRVSASSPAAAPAPRPADEARQRERAGWWDRFGRRVRSGGNSDGQPRCAAAGTGARAPACRAAGGCRGRGTPSRRRRRPRAREPSRKQDLAAVARGHDPGRAMDVEAGVVAPAEDRLAGVDAHPDPHLSRRRPVRASASARWPAIAASDGLPDRREDREDRIALARDERAAVAGDTASPSSAK